MYAVVKNLTFSGLKHTGEKLVIITLSDIIHTSAKPLLIMSMSILRRTWFLVGAYIPVRSQVITTYAEIFTGKKLIMSMCILGRFPLLIMSMCIMGRETFAYNGYVHAAENNIYRAHTRDVRNELLIVL